jgi:homogentisate 1,2-dioxygenase
MLPDTYRPPYYHRNVASELMGLIYGEYGGRSDAFKPGSVSFECGSESMPSYDLGHILILLTTVVPHGVAYEEFKAASENQPPVMQISEASIAFMFESSRPFTITDYAWNSDKKHEHEPKMWDNLVDNFSSHAKEIEEILTKAKNALSVS